MGKACESAECVEKAAGQSCSFYTGSDGASLYGLHTTTTATAEGTTTAAATTTTTPARRRRLGMTLAQFGLRAQRSRDDGRERKLCIHTEAAAAGKKEEEGAAAAGVACRGRKAAHTQKRAQVEERECVCMLCVHFVAVEGHALSLSPDRCVLRLPGDDFAPRRRPAEDGGQGTHTHEHQRGDFVVAAIGTWGAEAGHGLDS